MSKNLNSYIDANMEKYIDRLKELCDQPSVAAQNKGMDECAFLVEKQLKEVGLDTKVFYPQGGYPIIYGEIKGKSPLTLMLYNHYDVQPAEPLHEWKTEPFKTTIVGDKIYARGTSDNKGNITARLAAIEAILKTSGELPITIKYVIEGEEEIGSPSLPKFIEENKDLLKADACIWESGFKDDQDRPIIRLGNKGLCYVELWTDTAKVDLHDMYAPLIENAAWRLILALSTLKTTNDQILINGFFSQVEEWHPSELERVDKLLTFSLFLSKPLKKYIKNCESIWISMVSLTSKQN
ncbi:M20/M25/M40 family metallo-hydrolase [Thermanaerosceptrum fracticalcis]|uniref:M20/M25/M40 family metallo-hydrolase n=1 Tax=Thermanaerosceptrum fracticalcis TaxID=1712410 RepID=A0A7G6E6B4_THEFR|nr:M20/M25/M40 family metallo-hydrolase [Thermanaerosceptrum fracticalcis]QNB47618.1 M20/M25/M40 family metallo-hydrolase [Thermanaerosceptrum fracticalcis]